MALFDQALRKQRRETFQVFAELSARSPLPQMAVVDFQFVPAAAASWDGFEQAAQALGFSVERYEDGSTLEVSTRPLTLSAETIWSYEKQLTLLARKHWFAPDGWGFFGVDATD